MRNLGRLAVTFSSTPLFFTAFAGLAFMAACSSAPADSSSGAQDELTINPIGSENESSIVLQLPTDACLPGSACAKELGNVPVLLVDGTPVTIGATTRVKPGNHTIAINSLGYPLTTVAKQTATLTVPVVRRVCTDATLPNVPHTDFGSSVAVSNVACPSSAHGSAVGVPTVLPTLYSGTACSIPYTTIYANTTVQQVCGLAQAAAYSFEQSGVCVSPAGTGVGSCTAAVNAMISELKLTPGTTPLTDAYEATAPGTLSVTVSGATQTLSILSGAELDFPISLPATGTIPSTFGATLTFDDARSNPDAATGTIISSCAGERSYTIPAATGTPAPLALQGFVNPACTYTLNVGGRSTVLGQTGISTFDLHRVDVDDVTITREDGTTYTTKGTYTLNYGGVQVLGPFNTGTGVDVLSGTYQFSLSYTDFDGPQTQTQTLTF